MQVALVMLRSNGQRRSFPISRDTTTIGRREDCDLRIPLVDVSRKHCRLVIQGSALRLDDLGSSNGTYHNGQRVQGAVLKPGDSVRIGPVQFVIQIDGVPDENDITFSGLNAQEDPDATKSGHAAAASSDDSAVKSSPRPSARPSAPPSLPEDSAAPAPIEDDLAPLPLSEPEGEGSFDPLEALQDPAGGEEEAFDAQAAAELDFNFINEDESTADKGKSPKPQQH